jgi:hypothetical protein
VSEDAFKNAGKTRGKPFKAGHPGGPGRPAGSRNAATLLLDKLAEGDAKAVLEKQIELAKAGDQQAAQLVLSRAWPIRKGRPISLALPPIDTASDLVSALGTIANAVGEGALTPEEGAAFSAVLETKRRAIETSELEARIVALEKERNP